MTEIILCCCKKYCNHMSQTRTIFGAYTPNSWQHCDQVGAKKQQKVCLCTQVSARFEVSDLESFIPTAVFAFFAMN